MAGGGTPEHRRAARRYPFGMLCKTDRPRGPSLLCPGPAGCARPGPAKGGRQHCYRSSTTDNGDGTNGRHKRPPPATGAGTNGPPATGAGTNGPRATVAGATGPMYTPRVPPGGAALLVRGGDVAATAGTGGGYLSSWVSLRRLFSILLSPRMKAGLPRTVCT